MNKSIVLASLVAAFALTACGKKEEAPMPAPMASAPAPAPMASAPEAPASAASAAEMPASGASAAK